jgi:hypothetical protein
MHDDLDVPKILEIVLNRIKPDVITLEWDKRLDKIEWDFINAVDKLNFNKELFKEFGHTFLPLEYVECIRYWNKHNVPLHYIDARDDELEDIEINRLGIHHYLKNEPRNEAEWWMECQIAKHRTKQNSITYRKDINAKCELETALKNGNVGYRDKVMANRILDIYRYLEPEDNLVHVGGLAHMMKDENGKTLYEQLKSFNPKVIPLLEKYTRCSKVRQYLDY